MSLSNEKSILLKRNYCSVMLVNDVVIKIENIFRYSKKKNNNRSAFGQKLSSGVYNIKHLNEKFLVRL